MRHWLRFVFIVCFAIIVILPYTSVSAADQYRRWIDDKTFSCTTGSGVVYANISNQNVEFNNLPADAQFTINYIDNGVTTTDGPYTVEQTSGTHAYGSFSEAFPSYPFTFKFRLDTIINGVVVYQSSLTVNCSADSAPAPVTPVNVDKGPTNQYRRWINDKTFSCTTGSGVVYANISNQNVEFNNLPADAQFTINYIDNGVTTTDGPYTVEQTSGTHAYGSFSEAFPSYPFTFVFRLDTIINGVVVYQSSLIVNCSADSSGPLTPINVDLTISGPQQSGGAGPICPGVLDGRINNDPARDCSPPVAVYCKESGFDVYAINQETGRGWLALHVTQDDIDAVGVPEGVNATIAEHNGVIVSRLSDGPFQVNAWWPDGKAYTIAWDACPTAGVEHLAP